MRPYMTICCCSLKKNSLTPLFCVTFRHDQARHSNVVLLISYLIPFLASVDNYRYYWRLFRIYTHIYLSHSFTFVCIHTLILITGYESNSDTLFVDSRIILGITNYHTGLPPESFE